jgi:predicted DNA-binding antitoxin AbrB/MazE fold protein
MQKTFEAVYERGVLRPLEPLALPDNQRVTLSIKTPDNLADAAAYFTEAEWNAALHDDISLDEVHQALSSIDGSLSDAVVALRQDR